MKTYMVWGQSSSSSYFVAVATGNLTDIEDYYRDKCGYGPEVEEVVPKHVTYEMVTAKRKLMAEKEILEKRLIEVKNLIFKDREA